MTQFLWVGRFKNLIKAKRTLHLVAHISFILGINHIVPDFVFKYMIPT